MRLGFFLFFLVIGMTTNNYADPNEVPSTSAITYKFGGGRFGDQLLTYLHAKWAAYCYNLPFYYRPFKHADRLVLHSEDPILTKAIVRSFDKVVRLMQWSDLESHNLARILFSIPYFPECKIDLRNSYRRRRFYQVDWEHPEFKKEVRRLVSPIEPFKRVELPDDQITVAAHVRKGGGYDSLRAQQGYPLKFPTNQYYADQILLLDEMMEGKPIYVYVFTDDHDPWKIVEDLKKRVNKSHVTIVCHTREMLAGRHFLDDLFAMTQCDCLIRAESHFSVIAGKLKDFILEICPLSYHREKGEVVIDELTIRDRRGGEGQQTYTQKSKSGGR